MEPQKLLTKKYVMYGALVLGAIFVVLFFAILFFQNKKTDTRDSAEEILVKEDLNNRFENLSLEAKAVYVLDLASGEVLYEKNAEVQLPLASLTKTMVAFLASDIVPPYSLVRISADDLREQGDTGLLRDEMWNIRKLIDFVLVSSSNDAIRAIASVAGVELAAQANLEKPVQNVSNDSTDAITRDGSNVKKMTSDELFIEKLNETARLIGMNQTYFLNGSGLDLSGEVSGSYGSAHDMVILFSYILKNNPSLFEATAFNEIIIDSKNKNHLAVNTNKALNSIPSVLASKTGYTKLSGGNLVVAFDAGIMRPVVVSVLGSTYDGRFSDMEKIVRLVLDR